MTCPTRVPCVAGSQAAASHLRAAQRLRPRAQVKTQTGKADNARTANGGVRRVPRRVSGPLFRINLHPSPLH